MNRIFFVSFLLMLNFYNGHVADADKCPREIACSRQANSITISVLDANGNAIQLDEHFTFIKDSGKIFDLTDSPEDCIYTVITDDEMSDVSKTGSTVVFKGAVDGKSIVKEYTIGHNCCHIAKLDGASAITSLY